MELKILKQDFSIGKLYDVSQADLQNEFCFFAKNRPGEFTGLPHGVYA